MRGKYIHFQEDAKGFDGKFDKNEFSKYDWVGV